MEHAAALIGQGQDDNRKFTPLRLMDTHGISQANLVPFVSWVDQFIAIKLDGEFILLGFGILSWQEVGDVANISVKDIAFGIIDQVDDLVTISILAIQCLKK